MPEDMQWFIKGLYQLCLELFSSWESAMNGQSGWQFDHLVVTMGVYFGIQTKHKHHRKSSVHRKRSSTGRHPIAYNRHDHPNPLEEQGSSHGHQVAISSPKYSESSVDEIDRNYSVNFGININYVQSPVQCARSARVHLNEHDPVHRRKRSLQAEVGLKDVQQRRDSRESPFGLAMATRGLEASNELYDTFDNCLNISNQMDSVLSYYYLEEDDPTKVKVVEIFSVQQTQSTKQEDAENH